jgi:hypothetical protein
MMEAARTSEMSVYFYKTTRRNIREGCQFFFPYKLLIGLSSCLVTEARRHTKILTDTLKGSVWGRVTTREIWHNENNEHAKKSDRKPFYGTRIFEGEYGNRQYVQEQVSNKS